MRTTISYFIQAVQVILNIFRMDNATESMSEEDELIMEELRLVSDGEKGRKL